MDHNLSMATIYHWCPAEAWESADDEYVAPSLTEEGFIHFSYEHQVERTATALDRGRTGLVLLCVDPNALEVFDEDCYEIGERFPHVYGPIPVKAVTDVYPFPPQPDGSFRLPGLAN
ncbi:MAG: DUF952 domain-containing protein [Acidimicrobiia bacterium]